MKIEVCIHKPSGRVLAWRDQSIVADRPWGNLERIDAFEIIPVEMEPGTSTVVFYDGGHVGFYLPTGDETHPWEIE